MSTDARAEEFEHIELFGKPALFTNGRVNRDTVPEGWHCYDFRGSDSNPGKLNCVELHVGVNHSGAVLLPEEIDMKGKDYRRVRGQINFLGEYLTIREFCEVYGLECTVKEPQFHIRPARPDEAGIFYAQHPAEDECLGCIGHVRMDFGKSGNEFWHTWWPRGKQELNSPAFKSELQEVVDELRLTVLKNRSAMERFCYTEGLFHSLPSLSGDAKRLSPIKGLMPDPSDLPTGCAFHPRCPYATERCRAEAPQPVEQDGHMIRCHLFDGDELRGEISRNGNQ